LTDRRDDESLAWDAAYPWAWELARLFYVQAVEHHRAARQAASETFRGTLLDWARHYLPMHFTRQPSAMHRWLATHLDGMAGRRGTRLNVLGPRGGAKSTIGTLAYPLRMAVEGREPYVWIISDTRHQACAHLENIKSELAANLRLAHDYPQATGRGTVWRAGAVQLPNGVTIEAYGTGQRLRGRRHRAHRPTLIVCDDLQNDGHIRSPLQRAHSRLWFHGTLLKAGTPATNLVNLATALHREALAMELLSNPGWTSKIFRAIERWPQNMSLWEQWEAIYTDLANRRFRYNARRFYEEHQPEMDLGAVVLWPEMEDLYTLMCMRAESGRSSFEREKQNSPINPDLCEWPEEYFDEAIWFDAWPSHLTVKTLALDPSKGTDSRRGDYSAFVLLGVDREGMLYAEADLARRNVAQIVADGIELWRRWRPDAFGVEGNQFQDLLGGEFEAQFQRQGLLGVTPWMLDNRVNKLVRIRRLGPYLSARRLRFKTGSPSTLLLVDQLREFPVADHDDGPDALEMAIRMAADLLASPGHDDGLGNRLRIE
jgi:predicted phage terminase large subunit-like protein